MVPELRPRGVGEILDAAVALYRARFGALMRVTVAVVVPVAVLTTIVMLSALPDDFQLGPTGQATPVYRDTDWGVQIGAIGIVLVMSALATAFVTAVATRIVADAYVGSSEPTGAAVRNVGRRVPAIAGLTVVSTLGAGLGFMACIVPGVLLSVAWAVAVPALVLEGTRVFRSLGRSYSLTRSRFGLAFGVYWLSQLLVGALTTGLAALLGFVIASADSATGEVVAQSVANTVGSIVTTPFVATALVALYFDLRIRAEGFDVQMALVRLDARRAPAATTAP